ncbi:MAG: hypothetical protein IJ544_06510 [Prevotella sp.]|nr:hypothetical protein [Prevotella sp.]
MIKTDTIAARLSIVCVLLAALVGEAFAANTKTTVATVENLVTIEKDVDYIVASANPFGDEGIVNIANTDHAVLILNQVKPSAALKLLANHVQINGAKAVNNSNCQVKLYNRGCIILPYAGGDNFKPLTVYAGQNFEGESCNDFGLENSGGFMNTLTDKKLNNRIRSFKLKRGYMVTFSLRANGRGYSRCFIAADKDLEVGTLPAILDERITSYRVFKWYDTGKAALANDTRSETVSALNVTSCYSFGPGESRLPDAECVPHHIHEGWPSPASLGSVTYSPHMKTNNEPRNPSDDNPNTLEQILANWESLMATGMRLCSPSSWDGSDYVGNAGGFLREFFDSIDARGWRCDIIDLHCYWAEGTFNQMGNWTNAVHRPIWVSEWVWGASWNNNGIFGEAQGSYRDNPTTAQLNRNKDMVQSLCNKMNGYDFVERYYYWNSEANCSKIYMNGELTPAGEMYARLNSGVGYNGKYDYVPTTPPIYAPSNFTVTIADSKATFKWHDANGELNQLMEIQKKNESGAWETLAVIDQKETAADYTYVIDSDDTDAKYRLHVADINGKEYFSSDLVETGDAVQVGEKTMYAGGNQILNGDFDYGFQGWTNGKGTTLSQPLFQVVNDGGYGGGTYLQAHGSEANNGESSIRTVFAVEQNKDYFFSNAIRNGGTYQKVSLTKDGSEESSVIASMTNTTALECQKATFNAGTYEKLMLSYRWLGAKVGLDKVELRQLFDTRKEADADGLAWAKKKAEAQTAYYSQYAALNQLLNAEIASATNALSAEKAIENHKQATQAMQVADSIGRVLDAIKELKCANYDQMVALRTSLSSAGSLSEVVKTVDELKALLNKYLDFKDATVQLTSPSFVTATGWQTKAGTYTGGDQRTNTVLGQTCWNAWWSITAKDNPDATMEIRQTVSKLPVGIYALQCKATTQHFCLSDQHGYLKAGDQTAVTPALAKDYMDLPVDNAWQTLTTTPIYITEGSDATVGFVGSKKGATDGLFRAFGSTTSAYDNREGWWCATDFTLKYHPVYSKTVAPGDWGVICLPYSMQPGSGVKIYQIAGLSSDYTKVCLEEIRETAAGVPCIYHSEAAEAVFHEFGDAVTSTSDGTGNLRGFLNNPTLKAQTNSFVLTNGKNWEKVGSDRPVIGAYTGIIRPFSGNGAGTGFTLYDNWDGPTLPIVGITEEDKERNVALGIGTPAHRTMATDGVYTIDGRYVGEDDSSLKQGLYIKVADGRTYKTVVK